MAGGRVVEVEVSNRGQGVGVDGVCEQQLHAMLGWMSRGARKVKWICIRDYI
jgi:hypothetical protein